MERSNGSMVLGSGLTRGLRVHVNNYFKITSIYISKMLGRDLDLVPVQGTKI